MFDGAESSTVLRPRKSTQRPNSWLVTSSTMPSVALAAVKTPTEQLSVNPFHTVAPPTSFRSPHSSIKGKHKLSPSPSPRNHDYDFGISTPAPRPSFSPLITLTPSSQQRGIPHSSSSPASSPTPAFPSSVAGKAAGRARIEEESPIRHVPGHSRSLAAARRPSFASSCEDLFSPSPKRPDMFEPPVTPFQAPPPPVFQPIRGSQSQDFGARRVSSRIPRLTSSHPVRARNGNGALGGGKKAVSLGEIHVDKLDETFGAAFVHARKARSSMPVGFSSSRGHRRTPGEGSIARSAGHKSGLALSLSPTSLGLQPMPEFSNSNSSISSISSNSMTPPQSAEPRFEDIKPNPEVFDAAEPSIKQRFKLRDSTSSTEGNSITILTPPSIIRTGTMPKAGPAVKRARSLGNRPVQTTVHPPPETLASKFDFVVEGVSAFGFHPEDKPMMPGTPVKRHAFAHPHRASNRISMSISQPSIGSDAEPIFAPMVPPPSTRKPPASTRKPTVVPHLTLTTTSSPDNSGMDTDDACSPTVHLGSVKRPAPERLSLLRRVSGSSEMTSEEEATPTKSRSLLFGSTVTTPTPSPHRLHNTLPAHLGKEGVVPRLSLPTFGNSKQERRLNHRQSHPVAPPILPPEEEDIFEARFVNLNKLGEGAFSSVMQVQERNGDRVFAVKRTRGIFDGVKDRLRHLEEVDILRHLSKDANPHVIKFVDAWEQNRQLYIQTEACLGSLAAFFELFGYDHERLDEGRVWKVIRDISDGIRHIHSHGVIHFDIKPDNILVGAEGSLVIADFGLATRWPRIAPAAIIAGSGLGGTVGPGDKEEKLEREGDRVYMPPEMLRGVFVKAADVFSFGLVMLETAMNIYLPDRGPSWTALRENNFAWLDLSPLSPALADLITSCLNADPDMRPRIEHVAEHPVVQRSYSGGTALAAEDERWVEGILTASPLAGLDSEGDVVMGDA